MQAITIIGLDIAKSVFQVHGIDASRVSTRLDVGCNHTSKTLHRYKAEVVPPSSKIISDQNGDLLAVRPNFGVRSSGRPLFANSGLLAF